ncbi:hypothetical protein K443DRAFT_14096 [Laccaria amethystina LaAM-08-1]|uniref:Uncharacterized protein n=1 Tax=Laccaria amethystina LaAM-08-1 TaxID=1095629 RepID=A0A0C9WNA6_9AGAR|nr:hypothetical protein K443DRAFT_14096 [Laccaria amethystina LaAM-08-1]
MSEYDTNPKGEENEGWGPSLYNDNKGIKMVLVFTPLPPPLDPQKKLRAHSKPTVVT